MTTDYVLGLPVRTIATLDIPAENVGDFIDELSKSANGATRKIGKMMNEDVPDGVALRLSVDDYHAQLIADALRTVTA